MPNASVGVRKSVRTMNRQRNGNERSESISEIQNYLDSFAGDIVNPASPSAPDVATNGDDNNDISFVSHIEEMAEQMGSEQNTQYQSMRLVPAENLDDSDQMNYVFIVHTDGQEHNTLEGNMDGDGDGDDDSKDGLKIYDFEECDTKDFNEEVDEVSEEEYEKKKSKLNQRKSQIVTSNFMCGYCEYTSPKKYLLSRHLKSHSEERPHKCSICDRAFKTLPSLHNHVNTHTGVKPHHCKFCDSAFTTSGELVRHVRYKHTHEKPHKCSMCEYSSVELSKMRNHMRCHTGERPYQCPHCTYASPDTFKLKRHVRIHTGERPYVCPVCSARFTQSNSLKTHTLIHKDPSEKPLFLCNLCPATCGRKTDLRMHVQKMHAANRSYNCNRCGTTLNDKYSYKVHLKTHNGERCFKCHLCEYAATAQRHLETHMYTHTDQKPWACDQCDNRFRQKQLLRRHINLYHNPSYVAPAPKDKPHECPICLRPFLHKGNLIRHMVQHDPDNESSQPIKREKRIRVDESLTITESSLQALTASTGQTLSGDDGNQYVVLEVIQIDGDEQALTVVTNGSYQNGMLDHITTIEDDLKQVDQIMTDQCINTSTECVNAINEDNKNAILVDMQNCFGFESDGEEEDES